MILTLALTSRVVAARTRLARAAISINVAAIPGSTVEVARTLAVRIRTTSGRVIALVISSNGRGFVEEVLEIRCNKGNQRGPEKGKDGK